MAVPTPEPRVARFEKLAYGMFLHWGLYSLLGRGEWVQHLGPVAPDEYRSLMERFTAEEFDARGIARFAREVGMRYITITARHHDGFSLYDTRGLTDYDAPHAAAGRDLIAEFVEGCRAEDILPVFYHTTLDWTWNSAECDEATFNEYLDYHLKSVEILCTRYGDIGGLWFDGNWSRPDADWKVARLYEMIRSKQPEAMIVNNTGLQHRGEIGHPMIDSTTYERGPRGFGQVRRGRDVRDVQPALGDRLGRPGLQVAHRSDPVPCRVPEGGGQLHGECRPDGRRGDPRLRGGGVTEDRSVGERARAGRPRRQAGRLSV